MTQKFNNIEESQYVTQVGCCQGPKNATVAAKKDFENPRPAPAAHLTQSREKELAPKAQKRSCCCG